MGKETIIGILLVVLLFLFGTAFFASKVEVDLPYSTESQSVLDYAWETFADFINPFN